MEEMLERETLSVRSEINGPTPEPMMKYMVKVVTPIGDVISITMEEEEEEEETITPGMDKDGRPLGEPMVERTESAIIPHRNTISTALEEVQEERTFSLRTEVNRQRSVHCINAAKNEITGSSLDVRSESMVKMHEGVTIFSKKETLNHSECPNVGEAENLVTPVGDVIANGNITYLPGYTLAKNKDPEIMDMQEAMITIKPVGDVNDPDYRMDLPYFTVMPVKEDLLPIKEETLTMEEEPYMEGQYIWDECLECHQCVKGFTFDDALTTHMMSHMQEGNFQGSCIDEEFTVKQEPTSAPILYFCQECEEAFDNETTFRLHLLAHTEDSHHRCPVCSIGFKDHKCLENHMLIHRHGVQQICPHCGRMCDSAELLTLHLINVHNRLIKNICNICTLCGEKVSDPIELRDHMLIHAEVGPVEPPVDHHRPTNFCSMCCIPFANSTEFKIHMLSHTCEFCSMQFVTQDELNNHIQKQHMKRPNECSECSKTFTCAYNLNQHMKVHLKERKYTCSECQQKFTYVAQLRQHMLSHNLPKRRFRCSECRKQFPEESRLIAHIRVVHTGAPVHHCPQCGLKCSQKKQLDRHLQAFRCAVCRGRFCKVKYIDEHMSEVHPDEVIHRCVKCGKNFVDPIEYVKHMKTHGGKELHDCPLCCKRCKGAEALWHHVVHHSGNQGYTCYLCSKVFRKLQDVTKHMEKITKNLPYWCKFCNKKFPSVTYSKSHMKIHRHENPQSCSKCEEVFPTLETLNSHKCDSGIREYRCCHCSEKFISLSDIQRHISKVQPGVSLHACSLCGKFFPQEDNLVRHMSYAHIKVKIENQ